ncbi:glycosyltransferase family 4 protein [Rhizobium beringeri]
MTYIYGDDAANAELVALGVSMIGLNSRDLLSAERAKAFVTGIHNGAAVRMVANWIAAKDTANTVYHVHGWHQILSPAIFRALLPVARRCVVHAHDFFTACPNGAFFDYQAQEICLRRPLGGSCIATACDKRSYSHKLWRVARGSNILRLLKDQADFGRIILLHEKMAGFLVGAGYRPERLTTIRNPVAPLSIKRIEAEANEEFVFIGRLDEEKGIEDAVAATRKAGVKLCVIGDGPLMPLVAASEITSGPSAGSRMREIGPTIRKARALLMPSRYPEPFGLVAIEAARSGLPVIMSRSAFLAEEMQRAGMALACDTADESAFADTLTRFSQMPGHEVRAMSERAFRLSPDLASTHEEWRDALLAEYQSLISTNAVPELTDGVAIQGVLS